MAGLRQSLLLEVAPSSLKCRPFVAVRAGSRSRAAPTVVTAQQQAKPKTGRKGAGSDQPTSYRYAHCNVLPYDGSRHKGLATTLLLAAAAAADNPN